MSPRSTAILTTHHFRFIVLRRIFLMIALHYYYRSITMFITVLPVADEKYLKDTCEPAANTTTPYIVAQRVLKLLSGMGLSINGKHVYCGDYIYSGHTMSLLMGYLVIKECKLIQDWAFTIMGIHQQNYIRKKPNQS